MQPEIRDRAQLTQKDLEDIVILTRTVWPPKEPYDLQKVVEYYRNHPMPPVEKHFLIRHEGRLVGYSQSFARDLTAGGRTIRNMALCAVCVHPEARKFGYGRDLVKAAFGFVDNGIFECSVFQTSVPGFYEKLGSKVITTKFFDGVNKNDKPWWDPIVMVYPAAFDLGQGPVDLNGGAY
jgi:GNAT superfamily N-acetyltransferase